jgi:Aldo/keto reductases, related to diketogulonate reductase
LVLRWMIQREVVVIPKTVDPDRMAQNIDVFDFELSGEEMARIAGLHTGASQFFDHADPDMVRWLSARRLG